MRHGEPDSVFPEGTLPRLLERAASVAAGGESVGLRFVDRSGEAEWVSWEELLEGSRRVAGGLVGHGLLPRRVVALLFPTGRDFIEAFFGILLAGCVPAPLYPPVRLARLDEYLERTARMLAALETPLVLADRRVRRLLGEAILDVRPELGCHGLDELPAAEPLADGEAPSPAGPEDLALVQFSSGTTVDPKPVALSHRALLAQVEILNGFWPDAEGLRHSGVSWLPLYHDMGLIGCVLPALERPAVLTLLPPEAFVTRPALWLQTVSRYRATISPAPNFAYGLCVEKISEQELQGVDLSSWRVALNGAETIAADVMRAFVRRFAPYGFRAAALTPVYGLSEAALAVTFSELDAPFRSRSFDRRRLAAEGRAVPSKRGVPEESEGGLELVSVGRPVPGFELRLEAARGAPTREGEVGRVLVRGPSLMRGYLGRPEATRAVLRDGWLDTGDLAFQLDGELYLCGRAKDVVILRGENHAPEPLEQTASREPGVRTGCVVAASLRRDGDEGERLYLFVERRREAGVDDEALRRRLRAALFARHSLEAEIVLLEPGALPRTSSGKLRRAETVRRFELGELDAPGGSLPLRLARSMLRSQVALRRARRLEER